ncbi:hypothetical protein [Verrucomicrobium sp. BvORR106]|uniref:hypothetical protein n=1 Tax=Verrucomicrobium sp. BvORR106 TaxID=1403819 RepID=UPI0005713A5B|nr:hypothetical protein [Verrucomicrobium sp. BvORR106]
MNGSIKLFLLFFVHALPGLSGLMAREPVNEQEVAAAIEAFRKMDEWDIQAFQPIVAEDMAELQMSIGALAEGSALSLDRDSNVFAARSTREGLQRISQFCRHISRKLPQVITCNLEVFESDLPMDGVLLDSLATSQDHGTYAAALRAQAAKGQARQIAFLRGRGQSGEPLKFEQAGDDDTPAIKFEVTPTLGESDAVDVKIDLQVRNAPSPTNRADHLQQLATVKASFKSRIGASRAVAMWKPAEDGRDVTRTAILVVDAFPLLAAKAERKETLKRQLDSGKRPGTSEIKVPAGMELRTFPCPWNLFEYWDTASKPQGVVDPFASAGEQVTVADKGSWQTRSVEEVLKLQGIPQPKGSRAYWHPPTARLVAINTAENLEMIKVFAESTSRLAPITMVHEFLVVQGERTLMQSLADETHGQASHTAAWKRMLALLEKGDLKRTGFLRSETCSGIRLSLFAGLSRGESEPSEEWAPVKNGTRLAVDSVMQPDGRSIDLNLVIGQHRPPAPLGSLTTATSLVTGSPRLVHLWNLPDRDTAGKSISQAAFLRVSSLSLSN